MTPGFRKKPAAGTFYLLAVILLVLVAVNAHGQTLHRGVGPEPDSLDIHAAQSLPALNLLRDLHEGLLSFDAEAKLIPGLATAWSISDGGRLWTFELDPEARWSGRKSS